MGSLVPSLQPPTTTHSFLSRGTHGSQLMVFGSPLQIKQHRMNHPRIAIVILLACYGGISLCIRAKKPKNPKTLIDISVMINKLD